MVSGFVVKVFGVSRPLMVLLKVIGQVVEG